MGGTTPDVGAYGPKGEAAGSRTLVGVLAVVNEWEEACVFSAAANAAAE